LSKDCDLDLILLRNKKLLISMWFIIQSQKDFAAQHPSKLRFDNSLKQKK